MYINIPVMFLAHLRTIGPLFTVHACVRPCVRQQFYLKISSETAHWIYKLSQLIIIVYKDCQNVQA